MTTTTSARIEALLARLSAVLEGFAKSVEKEVKLTGLVETIDSWEQPLVTKAQLDRCEYVLKRVPRALVPEKLTPRQEEIIALILKGEHRKAIATQLGISARTVDVHLARIFDRYRVGSSIQLVRRILTVN